MKVLLWDVETSPIIYSGWGLYDQNIPHDNIIEDWKIICASWKWLGEDEVFNQCWRTTKDSDISPFLKKSDYLVIKCLHKALSEADVIVAQNGDAFDMKKFNTRAIYYGLDPLPEIRSVDTLKVARRVFKFTSNRLDYLGKYLGVGQKIDTPKGLWNNVMRDCRESLKSMIEYCDGDVRLLEGVYLKLLPYIKNHPNRNLHEAETCCPKCGSTKNQKRGLRYTLTTASQRFFCINCRGWFYGKSVFRSKVR